MTKEEVVQAYDKIIEQKEATESVFYLFDLMQQGSVVAWLIGISFFLFPLAVTALIISFIKLPIAPDKETASPEEIAAYENRTTSPAGTIFGISLFTTLMSFVVCVSFALVLSYEVENTADAEYKEELATWKEDYGYPYLESLTEIRVAVDKADVVPDDDTDYQGNSKVYGTISYYDEDGYYQTLNPDGGFTVQQNKSLDRPVFTYRELPDDVGSFDKGKHLLKLEVPEGYDF